MRGGHVYDLAMLGDKLMKRLAALIVLLSSATASASFCGGYTYQRTLTVNASAVSTNTLNYASFPVLISTNEVTLSTTTGSGGHLSTGYDLMISSDSNCLFQVNWDSETVQNVGVSTANYWAKLDFSSSTNRTYYLTYGNAAITTYQGNSTGTWDSNYKAVYHFNDKASSLGQLAKDSTSNGINQTYYQNVSGIEFPISSATVDGGSYYPSANENVGAASSGTAVSGTGTGSITIEGWVNFNTTHAYDSAWNNIVDMYDSSGLSDFSLSTISGDTFIGGHFAYFSGGFQDIRTSTANISTGQWNQFAISYDNTTLSFYFNGALVSTALPGGHSRTGDVPLFLAFGNYTSRNSDVKFDEIRVSNTIRNLGSINTSYKNQNSPSTFITIGPEQTSSASAAANTNPIGLQINGGKLIVNGVQLQIQ